VSIYGLWGVVGAHVVLNLPLALRLLLLAWGEVPAERFRLAATLGGSVFTLIELPLLARVLPGILATIFALCLGSFAVALILGGGPRATTVELAIYQAVRFEGDLGGAASLALVQYALGTGAVLLAALLGAGAAAGAVRGRPVERWDAAGTGTLGADVLAVSLAALVLLLPLGAAVLRGVGALPDLPAEAGGALLRSLLVALAATALCLVLATALALRGGPLAEAAGSLPLAASSLVLGLGALAVLGARAGPWALPAVALADALLALPFAVRALLPAVAEVEARHGRLASQLGLTGWRRVRLLHLPLLRRPLGFAAGLCAAFSAGNLGAVALLAGEGQATLPLLMARLMGAYRMNAGAAVGLLTLGLAFALFVAFDAWGRRDG
jgi:thiamine transport system permease protein